MQADLFSEAQAGQPLHRLHLLYHELSPGGSNYSYALATHMFERQLDLFSQLRKPESLGLWPELTFDDGHISNVEYALPILQSRNLIARFFITVGWTSQKSCYMGWPELKLLHQSGQLIGAHGWSHTFLTHCTQKDLNKELIGARLMLEDRLGAKITTMSLPGGRFNRRVLTACREAGYSQVFTSVPKVEQARQEFLVGRLNVRADMTLEVIQNLLRPGSSALSNLERQYRIKSVAKSLLGDRIYEKLWALMNRKAPDSGAGGVDQE